MKILQTLLASPLERKPFVSLEAWWADFQPALSAASLPIDAAILGGFGADRLAPAFAAGYQAALRCLVPHLPQDRIVSLCITERGGGHPRAIRTTLRSSEASGFLVSGDKRWATLSSHAGLLLVAATTGNDPNTLRPLLRVVCIEPKRPGVKFLPMPETPFVPEIPHAEVSLTDVVVHEPDFLEGDGYDRYIKPFRTIEDLHVNAAIAGYLVFVARELDFSHAIIERLICLLISLRALALEDPSAPLVHIGTAGALAALSEIVTEMEGPFAAKAPEEFALFDRDRGLFAIAAHVRGERTKKAWERLGAIEPMGGEER